MDEIADRALNAYGLTRQLDAARVAQSREKIIRYIDKLGSAGQVCAGVFERDARGAGPPIHGLLASLAYKQPLQHRWWRLDPNDRSGHPRMVRKHGAEVKGLVLLRRKI